MSSRGKKQTPLGMIEWLYKEGRITKEEYDAATGGLKTEEALAEDLGDPRMFFEHETKGDRAARKRRQQRKKYKEEHPSVEGLTLREYPKCGYFRLFTVDDAEGYKDPEVLFAKNKQSILNQIRREADDLDGVKFSIGIKIEFIKTERDGTEKQLSSHKRLDPAVVFKGADPTEAYNKQVEMMKLWIDLFTSQEGTGAAIDYVKEVELNIARYEPIKGSSYMKLPPAISNTKSVINVKNSDNRCVEWSIMAARYPPSHTPQQTYHYVSKPPFKMDGIDFPTPIDQIPKIEKQNNLALNVYGYSLTADGKRASIFPYHISEQPYDIERINLLLATEDDGSTTKSHYCWIKNLDKLLFHQSKTKWRMYYCDRCLHGYAKPDRLEAHKEDCRGVNKSPAAIRMPPRDNKIIRFKNHHKQLPVPYVIYAYLEALIEPMDEPAGNQTRKTSKHTPCGFCYKVVRYDGKSKKPVLYRGPDAVKRLIEKLKGEVSEANYVFSHPKPLVMTTENKRDYNNATECWICEKPFVIHSKNIKVRDHCHFTGEYRGAAHNHCNLKLRVRAGQTKIPVVFHNLRGYDAHHIMQELHTAQGRLSCIANNPEKYISFAAGQLTFVDSLQFMNSSLDKLAASTPKEEFQMTNREFGEHADLMTKKGVFPYEYLDSFERFRETSLPPIDKFYNSLTDETISPKQYEHAKNVWETFKCRDFGDYHDLYLKTDVLLLADIFQAFRKTCKKAYKLDPLHQLTSPGLAWEALLKKSGAELELLTDEDKYLFIEKGMRGGISVASKRYAKANNPYVPGYDPTKETSYIMYLDANNLYGYAMSEPMPYSGFRWRKNIPTDLERFYVDIPRGKGWILEVDLEYPPELHEEHGDYPLAPEKLDVKKEWLSPYQQRLLGDESLPGIQKLVPNVMDKKKYVVHHRNLEFYVKQGLRLTKIHRILEFVEKPWMKSYIDMNTEMRKEAKSDFEKDFYKLMNNSVFGKTMENLRKRINMELVRTDGSENNKIRKLVADPAFSGNISFTENLSAIQSRKKTLLLNKPIQVGFAVLELSKLTMYRYYYEVLKPRYGDDCTLLYTDTDSLLVEIKTEDFYKDMEDHKDEYDLSDYPRDHPLHDDTNKKVMCKMKDECAGTPVAAYVGLRSKLYTIKRADEILIKKAKGVARPVLKKKITFENYIEALRGAKFKHTMNILRSWKHRVYGVEITKTTLNPMDTKRYLASDGITTYPFGYKGKMK